MTFTTTCGSRKTGPLLILAGFLGAASSGCIAPMQMAVPADVASSTEVFAAKDRSLARGALANEAFLLGPYRIDGVDRSGTRTDVQSPQFEVFGLDASLTLSKKKESYAYLTTAPSGSVTQGYCERLVSTETHALGGISESTSTAEFACTCASKESKASADVGLTRFAQLLRLGGVTYKLESVNKDTSGYDRGVLGWVARSDGALLGAVETSFPGRVWTRSGLAAETRDLATCLFAGMMLNSDS